MLLIPLRDAARGIRREFDPTHTTVLRRRFRHTADFNLRRLRGQLRQAVVEFNILGLHGGAVNPFRGSADSLQQFSSWLETAAQASLDARWWCDPFLQQAVASGVKQASKELPHGNFLAPPPTSFASLHQLARSELRGIIAALVQKATRAAHTVTAGRSTPSRAFVAVAQPLDTDIRNRLFAFASTMTVKAHNKAKLESYRVNGVDLVGVNPEHNRHQRDALTRDDDDDELVGWRTAGDDLVCEACEDAAEDSPYDLDEAESLIPLHPWCRCSVYPWFDRRYRHDGFYDEEAGHEFRGNQYVPGISGGGEPGSQVTHAALNPEVVNVGGDAWNKETALRLETQYASAKPALDELVNKVVGDVPEVPAQPTWNDLSNVDQNSIEKAWYKDNLQAYLEDAENQWYESGDARVEAAHYVVGAYIGAQKKAGSGPDWFTEALEDVREQREEDGKANIPYTNAQLKQAIGITPRTESDAYEKVTFDDKSLMEPSNAPPAEQATLPGIEAADNSQQLTAEMREQLSGAVVDAVDRETERYMNDDLKPPAYLNEMAKEMADESWNSMDDNDKYTYGLQHNIIEPDQSESDAIKLPDRFNPLDEDGDGYQETGALAREMSVHRSADLLMQRGLVKNSDEALVSSQKMDRELWSDWKGSSTSMGGRTLQVAIARELSGKLLPNAFSIKDVEKYADERYKGMAVVQAYVRAKWETTQYILDKAGDNTVDLYRAINVPLAVSGKSQEIKGDIEDFTRLPDFRLLRNGAASTTTSRSVANQWDGSIGRVVLRLQVPRTTVVTTPCYGQNNYHEHEVVIAGASMKAWTPGKTAHRTSRKFRWEPAKSMSEPYVIDLLGIDLHTGKNWLALDKAEKSAAAQDAIRQKFRNRYLAKLKDAFDPDEPRDPHGEWTSGGGTSYEFVSPSVAAHLDFNQAVAALQSRQQHAMGQASKAVNKELNLAAEQHNIVGAWADGAENSTMDYVANADWDKLKLSAAMKGWLGDQKQVLIFHEQPDGKAVMAHFEAKGSLADIHARLLRDGVAFHTLVPNPGGATVYVADLDGSAMDAIKKAAASYDAEVGIKFGRAEFIGTQKQDGSDREQRDDARKIYEGIIHESKVEGHDEAWQRLRGTWGEAVHPSVKWQPIGGGSTGYRNGSGTRLDIVDKITHAERLQIRSEANEMNERAGAIEQKHSGDPRSVREYGALRMTSAAVHVLMAAPNKFRGAYLLDDNGHLQGAVAVEIKPYNSAEISFLGTLKQGMGEHLLKVGEAIARDHFSASNVTLTSLPDAKSFYERHGYTAKPGSHPDDLEYTKTLHDATDAVQDEPSYLWAGDLDRAVEINKQHH